MHGAAAQVETELCRFRLPVCRRTILLRHPAGAEDFIMLETARTPCGDAKLALVLANRLAATAEGDELDWSSVSVTDLDAFVLRLRQATLGDRIWTDMACPAAVCGKRIDIEFGIEQFLAHNLPDGAGLPDSRGPNEHGWFTLPMAVDNDLPLEINSINYRLPTVQDQIAMGDCSDPGKEMAARCIRPANLPAELMECVEAAMEARAPSLSTEIQGSCPECGTAVTMYFDSRWFCFRELRDRAASIYQDVDFLAKRYHWSEAEILALPRMRRSAYVELARQAEGP
jgi:hypothetical protein